MDNDQGIRTGPMGRGLRFLAGIALIFEGSRHLLGTNAALILATSAVVLGEVAFYAVIHLIVSRTSRAMNPWISGMLAVVPIATVFLLSDAPGRLGTLLFVGISLLMAAARADGGCEVMTLPAILFGKRTHLVCVTFSPIDWLENKVARNRSAT